jgi:hypothetical protein
MQPTYLPWAGYFSLMIEADAFVFLDDVALAHQSWQTRNRIVGARGVDTLLSVPIRKALDGDARILATHVNDEHRWRRAHMKTLQQQYARAPFADAMLGIVETVYALDTDNLAELNIAFIEAVAQYLNVSTRTYRASALRGVAEPKAQGVVDLVRRVDGATYLSPAGAFEYIEAAGGDALFAAAHQALRYAEYAPAPYPQVQTRGAAFVPFMSVVDVLANVDAASARDVIAGGLVGWRTSAETRALHHESGDVDPQVPSGTADREVR